MRTTRVLALLLTVGVAGTATAASESTVANLTLKKVSKPPRSLDAGDDFILRVKVKNLGSRAGRGRVQIHFVDGPRPYSVPRRVARFSTKRIKPGFFRRFTLRTSVPLDLAGGSYRLRTCLKPAGRAKQCRLTRRVRVTAAT